MIDFSPNNAPLKNLAKPSLKDIARLRETDPVTRWSPPPPVAPARARLCNTFMLIFCGILSSILSWASLQDQVPTRTSPWVDRQDIRSIYVAVKAPSPALVGRLQLLVSHGADVRIVTGHPVSIPGATVGVVGPDRIEHEGVMINGLSFYELNL